MSFYLIWFYLIEIATLLPSLIEIATSVARVVPIDVLIFQGQRVSILEIFIVFTLKNRYTLQQISDAHWILYKMKFVKCKCILCKMMLFASKLNSSKH